MASTEVYVLEQIGIKAQEMSEELTTWAREKLLLKIGTQVEVTIRLVEVGSVEVVLKEAHEPKWVPPTEKDWEEVLSLPWASRKSRRFTSERLVATLRSMKDRNNRSDLNYMSVERDTINSYLRSQGNKFKITSQGRLEVDSNR